MKQSTTLNNQTSKLKEFSYQKMDYIFFDQLIKSYPPPSKKNVCLLVQKLTFLP